MPCPCSVHAVPLPCHAAKGLESVFPIWFTQCGRVWCTLAMPCSDHAVLLKATAQHGMVGAWHGHGMASVNQTRPHCVNQMGKIYFKHLAARHGRGTAWARHAMCESVLRVNEFAARKPRRVMVINMDDHWPHRSNAGLYGKWPAGYMRDTWRFWKWYIFFYFRPWTWIKQGFPLTNDNLEDIFKTSTSYMKPEHAMFVGEKK